VKDQPPYKFKHWMDDISNVSVQRVVPVELPVIENQMPTIVAVFCIDSTHDQVVLIQKHHAAVAPASMGSVQK
jgi:hypothetical protein